MYCIHYNDVIMSEIASEIPSFFIICSAIYSGADQSNHQSSASLAFVQGIHRWHSPHKGPVTPLIFPFDDVNVIIKRGGWLWMYLQVMTSEHGIVFRITEPLWVSSSYYSYQPWLIIIYVLWHSTDSNSWASGLATILYEELKILLLKLQPHLTGANMIM